MTCERRKHTVANTCARARANNRTSVQFQSLDTTSCAIAFFAWLVAALRRANALFICRMQEVEFNIIDIIGVTYAENANHPPSKRIDGVQMLMTSPRTPSPTS